MLKSLLRVRNVVFTQRYISDIFLANLELPPSVLPTNDIVNKLNKYQKEKLARRLVELEVFIFPFYLYFILKTEVRRNWLIYFHF